MIFPGMDPYLEDPVIWHGFHATMTVYMRDFLQPLLRPRYIAAVEDRSHGAAQVNGEDAADASASDSEIRNNCIEIHDGKSGDRVVTVIELICPSDKTAGPERERYLAKQREAHINAVHLVEIDLQRQGIWTVAIPKFAVTKREHYDYLLCVSRAKNMRDLFDIYRCSLRRPLPKIRVPLADGDPDVLLDLQAVVAQAYDSGTYAERLKYEARCVPALSPEDQAWANELILQHASNEP